MGVAALLTSCNTVNKTARTAETFANLQSATVVDIVPATSERISHTLVPGQSIRRGGENNVKQAVEHEALVKYGNADILLEPQYVVEKERTLFGSKITSITVSGRPAYYANFRALHDSVWCNPAFRGMYVPMAKHRATPFFGGSKLEGGYGALETEYSGVRDKGFALFINPVVGAKRIIDYGYDWYGDDNTGVYFAAQVYVSAGYQFNPRFFLGAGLGLLDSWHGDIGSFPIYLNTRINLSKKDNGFFVDGKIGSDLYNEFSGVFAGVGIGYSFERWDVAYQYSFHEYYADEEQDCSMWGLSVSYRF